MPYRLCLFIQSTNGQLDKSGTGTGKGTGTGTGTGTGRGTSPGPQCHNGKANDRRKMTVAMLKNVTTTTTAMLSCVCVSRFFAVVSGALSELQKFFCYLNHVSLSKQHLPIQARQQLPHLLPRLHCQRPKAVVTVSLPSLILLWLLLLCALWAQTSRRSLFLASCQVAISSRKNICAPFASLLLLWLLLLLLLLLSLCNFHCVLREHKTFPPQHKKLLYVV